MTFYLQQGYGMMGLNEEFADKIDDIGFILSPRALQRQTHIDKIKEHGNRLRKRNKKILFDPQFYEPKTNLSKILKFPYFDGLDYSTVAFDKYTAQVFSENVIKYQDVELNVDEYIIPGMYANSITEDWVEAQENMIDGALSYSNKKFTYQTLALGPDVINNQKEFNDLINRCTQYPVDGYYIVLKSPDNFLIQDQNYLYNILDALISLNLAGKKVIMGYGNQQSLIFSGVGVSGIATGNYRNVRSFNPEIFFESDEEDIKRKGIWYYDGNTLGEYNVKHLSLAYMRGLSSFFGPSNEYSTMLLNNPNPAGVPWSETLAFRHYLFEMNNKWANITQAEPKKRMELVIDIFEQSKTINEELTKRGFKLGNKGYDIDTFDSTIGALEAIKYDRGDDLEELKEL